MARVTRRYRTPAERNQIPGTMTEKVEYSLPDGRRLAIAIQYLEPSGALGASGQPDPKWLAVGSEAWIPSHGDDVICSDCAPPAVPES